MKRPSPRLVLLAALLVLSTAFAVAPLAAASSSYDVSVADSIDVPDRTIEIEGERDGLTFRIEFDITSIARVAPGEEIDVDTTGPENGSYYAEKFNSDADRLASAELSGDDSTTFSTDGDDPGTYLVAIRIDDYEIDESAVPVVVAAYDAELTVPEEAAPGETVNATVELEPYDQEPPIDSVELVLMDGNDPDPIEATTTDSGNRVYETEITVPEDEGEYTVFSTVFGEEALTDSEQEMLEITETSIQVSEDAAEDGSDGSNEDGSNGDDTDGNETDDGSNGNNSAPDAPDDDESTDDGGDGGGGSAPAGDDSDTSDDDSDTSEEDDADANTQNGADTDGEDDGESDTDGEDTDSSTDSGSSDGGDDDGSSDSADDSADGDDGSIEPNEADDDEGASDDQAPLTGIPHFIAALLLLSVVARRS
ncbi:hypothetical protein GJ633_11885 [Halorubrum sp. CBA1125]|uniref:hypothetical protein n=1 Tax=Halorubrum sp. CBA1125 TaxID=2668072 RepID=UPI0012E74A56|nr:hypothetical protein [Halorubrum sp. CBA1125]MUW15272.1 hypothetical protein [Halorubrum sp. CBA1125]